MAEQTIVKTLVSTTVDAPVAELTGDLSIETVTNMLLGAYPFLANSVASEEITQDDSGNTVRFIRYSEKLGTKGN
jgi:hypothetical protein